MQCAMELERIVNFKKGRGGSSKSVFKILNDVNAKDADKKLLSNTEEHPRLAVFTIGKTKIEMIKIIGDACVIHMDGIDLVASLLLLVCAYYVFDFAYPRKYQQLLGLIQHEVLGDNYTGTKTNGFTDVISGVYGNRKCSVDEIGALSSEDESVGDMGRGSKYLATPSSTRDRQRNHNSDAKSKGSSQRPKGSNQRGAKVSKSVNRPLVTSDESEPDSGCLPVKRKRKKKVVLNM